MGAFHSVSARHIDRYLNEFSFRWDNRELDGALMVKMIRGSEGMRLTYRPILPARVWLGQFIARVVGRSRKTRQVQAL